MAERTRRARVKPSGVEGPVRTYPRRNKEPDPFEGVEEVEDTGTFFTKLFDKTVLVVDGIVRGQYRSYAISDPDTDMEWFRCQMYHEHSENVFTSWKAVGRTEAEAESKARSSMLEVLAKMEAAAAAE